MRVSTSAASAGVAQQGAAEQGEVVGARHLAGRVEAAGVDDDGVLRAERPRGRGHEPGGGGQAAGERGQRARGVVPAAEQEAVPEVVDAVQRARGRGRPWCRRSRRPRGGPRSGRCRSMRGWRARAVRIFRVLAGASGTCALQAASTAPLSRSATTQAVVRSAGGRGAPGWRSTCKPGWASRSPPTADAGRRQRQRLRRLLAVGQRDGGRARRRGREAGPADQASSYGSGRRESSGSGGGRGAHAQDGDRERRAPPRRRPARRRPMPGSLTRARRKALRSCGRAAPA